MAPEDTWKKEFERLNRKIDRLSMTNEKPVLQGIKQSSEFNGQNKRQSQIIDKLSRTIDDLKQVIGAKDAGMALLEERKNKNSGKPSSADFFNKPKPSSINTGGSSSPKKKTGGQNGHEGSTLQLNETPDAIHRCIPSQCAQCTLAEKCSPSFRIIDSRDVVDVRIVSQQSGYDRMQGVRPRSGLIVSGDHPQGVNACLR